MATERLSMRKTKEILRHKWLLKMTHREVANAVGVSTGSVSKALTRAAAAQLTWELVAEMDEAAPRIGCESSGSCATGPTIPSVGSSATTRAGSWATRRRSPRSSPTGAPTKR
jgi:hypothetical protein